MLEQSCQEEYRRRIHKVQDYIESHLEVPLSIEVLSNVAGFSKYHFSRIFKAIHNESLAHYVNRIRMEKALFMLAHREDKNMTDISCKLGYTDSAIFSRAFKNYYGMSPTDYRKEYSKNCKDSFLLAQYNSKVLKKENENYLEPVIGQIKIRSIAPKQVVYVRHIGTYEIFAKKFESLIQHLFNYAKKQSITLDKNQWILTIYHDNPEFCDENQFRTSLCLVVPDDKPIVEDGILGTMTLEGGLYAVGHFNILQEQYSEAWNSMYQQWLTLSSYVPRNSYPFEVYCNNPSENEDHIHEVEIYVPIKPFNFK